MLADGTIDGQRIGRDWVIGEHALDVAVSRRRCAHRPWHPRSAWAVLALADGGEPGGTASQRYRAVRRLEVGLLNLLECLSSRAIKHRLYVHPATRDRIAAESGVVRTAASASPAHGLDIIDFGPLEAYVSQSTLESLCERFVIDERNDRPNMVLQVVRDDFWPFGDDAEVAPAAVVAVDLIESEDGRCKRAGAQLLKRL